MLRLCKAVLAITIYFDGRQQITAYNLNLIGCHQFKSMYKIDKYLVNSRKQSKSQNCADSIKMINDVIVDPFSEVEGAKNMKSYPKGISQKLADEKAFTDEIYRRQNAASQDQIALNSEDTPELTDSLSTEDKILIQQGNILQSLPLEVYLSFRNVAEQLLPRCVVFALTLHVMLLIPVLRFVKFSLHESIVPYLYLGPIIIAIPYFAFWLWENGYGNLKVIDELLFTYITKEKNSASFILQNKLQTIMEYANNEEEYSSDYNEAYTSTVNNDNDGDYEKRMDSKMAIRKIAGLRLLSSIDVENFANEVLAIKQMVKGTGSVNDIDKRLRLATSIRNGMGNDEQLISESVKQKMNSNAGESATVAGAVKALIETSMLQGESPGDQKKLLMELKKLQQDLNEL